MPDPESWILDQGAWYGHDWAAVQTAACTYNLGCGLPFSSTSSIWLNDSASPAAPSPAAALPLVAVPEVWGTPGTSPARPAAPVEVGLAAVLALGARGAGWGAGLVAGIVVVEGLRPPLMPQ